MTCLAIDIECQNSAVGIVRAIQFSVVIGTIKYILTYNKMITKIALNPSWLCRQTSCMLNAKRTSFSRRNSRGITDKEEPEFFSDTLPNPVADIEAKIEESKRKLQWRQPMNQPTLIAATDLRFLAPERLKSVFEYFQRPLSQMSLTDALDVMNYQSLCVNQRFIPDRHRILGNDLAAAHFIVARGGQVKYVTANVAGLHHFNFFDMVIVTGSRSRRHG